MNEVETVQVIPANEVQAQQALVNKQINHSILVMAEWGDGEIYNEAVWVEKGKQAINKTLEGMFELGKALIVLKEHTEHGRFMEITEREFNIKKTEVARLINATMRFGSKEMKQVQAKFTEKGIGKSKILELLVEDDDSLIELANGGDINGNTLDDVDRMTIKELRLALREAREDSKAKDKVMSEKNAKIDELAEKLAKNKNKQPKPADVARELSAQLASAEVSARSEISKLKDIFDGFVAHQEAHGSDHTALMVGAINQLILDCEILRGQYLLPEDAPTGEVPAWLTDDESNQSDDKVNDDDVPLPFDYEDDEV